MTPLDLLNSGNYQTYNRKVAQEFGSINAAIMLSELINRYQHHNGHSELKTFDRHEGEWFYYTIEKCAERTVLSKSEQAAALNILEPYKLFEKKKIGVPGKRHFKLDVDAIYSFLTDCRSTKNVLLEVRKSDLKKSEKVTTIKEPKKNLIKDNNKKEIIISILKKLKITAEQRESIAKEIDEEKAKVLVKRVLKWKDRENDALACNLILRRWDDWGDSLTEGEKQKQIEADRNLLIQRVKENRGLALKMKEQYPNAKFEVKGSCIEIKQGNTISPFGFAVSNFKNVLQTLI